MSPEPPRLAVVIPAWNAERYLGAAIESVLAQAADAPRWGDAPLALEVVVVDDGSRDGTAAVAAGYPGVRVVSQPNAGVAAARNRGVAASTSELLAFLDADDLWAPGRLVRQLAALAAEPDAIVLGQVEERVSPDVDPERAARMRPKPGLLPAYLAGGLLCRRAVFDRVGPFDTTMKMGETIEWFQRARQLALVERVLPDLVLVRRLHGDNLTLTSATLRADYLAMARALIAKKRAQEPPR